MNAIEDQHSVYEAGGECPSRSNSNEESDLAYISKQSTRTITINGQIKVDFNVDTGAPANLIPKHYLEMQSPKAVLQTTRHRLTSYCGSQIPSLGTYDLQCCYQQGQIQFQTFHIVASRTTPIIGLKTSKDLNLVKLILNAEMQKEQDHPKSTPQGYNYVFEGIGKLAGDCEIHLKEDVTPIVHPARKVPISMRDKLKDKLACHEKLEIIEKVSQPTEWVNAMVMVNKKDRSGWL